MRPRQPSDPHLLPSLDLPLNQLPNRYERLNATLRLVADPRDASGASGASGGITEPSLRVLRVYPAKQAAPSSQPPPPQPDAAGGSSSDAFGGGATGGGGGSATAFGAPGGPSGLGAVVVEVAVSPPTLLAWASR